MAYAPFNLQGKVALITGGNRGIGFAMAQALAQSGADVAIWGRTKAQNEEAAAKLAETGVRVRAYAVDVGEESAVVAAMAAVAKDLGRIDFVAANAGIGQGAPAFHSFPTETWRRVMQINLDGVFFTLREACKHMAARAEAGDPGGSLLAVSSVSAVHGAPRNQAYAAAKGALVPMIKGIAVEYARHGVRANVVLPGWIATDMTEAAQQWQTFTDKVIARVPQRRWGKPEEFGGLAVYLASDASSFHSGDLITIDGGYTAF